MNSAMNSPSFLFWLTQNARAFACPAGERIYLRSNCFRSPFGRASYLHGKASAQLRCAGYFSCSCKKSNQKNTPQRIAPCAHPALRVRVSGRVALIARPCTTAPSRASCARPLRGLIDRCHRHAMGTPESRAARSCAPKQGEQRPRCRCFCAHDARRSSGPLRMTAAGAAMPAASARWIAPIARLVQGRTIRGTQAADAHFSGRSPKSAMRGCVSFAYFSFAQAKKSRSLARRASESLCS